MNYVEDNFVCGYFSSFVIGRNSYNKDSDSGFDV